VHRLGVDERSGISSGNVNLLSAATRSYGVLSRDDYI